MLTLIYNCVNPDDPDHRDKPLFDDPAGNKIAAGPGKVMVTIFFTCVLLLAMIWIIEPGRQLQFDVSIEQFRIEGHSTTIWNDWYKITRITRITLS